MDWLSKPFSRLGTGDGIRKSMKTIWTLLSVSFLALVSFSAQAITYRDTDSFGLLGTKVDSRTPLVGYFQINANDADGIPDLTGYNPASQQIYSASVAFLLGDDFDFFTSETVDITLGASLFLDGGSVPTIIGWRAGSVTGTALFDLQADGVLKYTIASDSGDFLAYKAVLQAEAGSRSVSVPDGGTMLALFGLALTGLGVIRRKFAL